MGSIIDKGVALFYCIHFIGLQHQMQYITLMQYLMQRQWIPWWYKVEIHVLN